MSDESATPPVPAQPVPEAPKQEPWEAALEDKLTGSSPAEVLSVMGKVRGWFANYCQKCGAYVEINPCKTCTAPAPPPPAPVVAHVEPPPPPAAPAILPQRPALDDQIRGGLWGVLVADAFGVPHEFKHAAKIPEGKDLAMVMPPTYKKTFPKVPYGTWSDDGALTLALADSIAKVGYLDPEDFGMRLMGWFTKGDFTPDRKAFDVGNTTQEAILRLTRGHSAKTAGLTADSSNGNGFSSTRGQTPTCTTWRPRRAPSRTGTTSPWPLAVSTASRPVTSCEGRRRPRRSSRGSSSRT